MHGWTTRLLAVAYVAWGGLAFAKPTKGIPPVGDRIYLIEKPGHYKPTTIVEEKEKPRSRFLKDPMQPDPNRRPPKPQKIVRKAKKIPDHLPARLSFRSLAVDGKLSRPRVDFDQETLPVKRADEPLELDFLGRIFQSADRTGGI